MTWEYLALKIVVRVVQLDETTPDDDEGGRDGEGNGGGDEGREVGGGGGERGRGGGGRERDVRDGGEVGAVLDGDAVDYCHIAVLDDDPAG